MLWFGVVWWRLAWRDFGIVGQVCVGVAWHGVAWLRVAWFGVVWCALETLKKGALEGGDSETGTPWKQELIVTRMCSQMGDTMLAPSSYVPKSGEHKQQVYYLILFSTTKDFHCNNRTQQYLNKDLQST